MPKSIHPSTNVLCLIELLERTSYYGMRAVLVLCMVAGISAGGFGWSERDALRFYGLFTGAAWFSPLFGGLLTDRWLGVRRAVVVGGCLLLAGYLALLAATALPEAYMVNALTSLRDWSAAHHAPLGQWPDLPASAIGSHAHTGLTLETFCFVGGLACIVLGNAFFKPSITLMVGNFYQVVDPRRERAYFMFYMSVYMAVLLSGVVIGTLGERVGWAIALLSACTTMAAAMLLFLWQMKKHLDLSVSDKHADNSLDHTYLTSRGALLFIGIHAMFAVVFWAAYEQSGGLLSLFIAEQVNRNVFGWQVPTTWFFSLTAVVAIGAYPFLPRLIDRWEASKGTLDISTRFGIGLALGAAAFAIISVAASGAGPQSVPSLWPVLFYALLTVGELMFSPTGFSMVGRLVRPDHQSSFMGLWMLSVAIGSFLGGQIGALSTHVGRASAFAGTAAALAFATLITFALRPLMNRLNHCAQPRVNFDG